MKTNQTKTFTKTTKSLFLGLALAALPLLASCEFGGDAANEPAAPSSIEESLTRLGVPMDSGPRLGSNGKPLPPSFGPYGEEATLSRSDELFMMHIAMPGAPGNAGVLDLDGAAAAMTAVDQPWASGAIVGATAADVDRDGREETIVVSNRASSGRGVGPTNVELSIMEDAMANPPFAVTTTPIGARLNVAELTVAAADFDGDRALDLVVGVVSQVLVALPPGVISVAPLTRARAELLFLRNDHGTFVLDQAASKVLVSGDAADGPANASLAFAPARLDADRPSELAVVVNTSAVNGVRDPARVFIFDDATTGYRQLEVRQIQVEETVTIADVAAGDLDGDELDELVVGGVTSAYDDCDGPVDPKGERATVRIAAAVWDDGAHGFAPLGAAELDRKWGTCGKAQVRWAPIRILNDDDGQRILVGDTLMSAFHGSTWARLGQLAPGSLIPDTATALFARTTAAVAALSAKHTEKDDYGNQITTYGDEIAVHLQGTDAVRRFRAVADESGDDVIAFQEATLKVTAAPSSTGTPLYPVLLPVNVDDDSLVVRRADDVHQLVFTQPIVIAALAAPPCQIGIGQNTDACVTSYGSGSHVGGEAGLDVSRSISISAGAKINGSFVGEFEAKGTLSKKATLSIGAAYDLSRSVTYQTGALEDAVVFTTVPYDQYHYVVVSGAHAGETITVSLPRSPVVMIAERHFYNQSVVEGGLKIGDTVFTHTPGEIASYAGPDAVTRARSMGTRVVEDGPQAVGQGGSSVTLSHTVAADYSVGASLELGFEFECEATAGIVLGGFSVGVSATASLKVTTGTSTSYAGTVGSIDADHFADNFYEYGLYTYVQADPASGQRFEVLNWWVQK